MQGVKLDEMVTRELNSMDGRMSVNELACIPNLHRTYVQSPIPTNPWRSMPFDMYLKEICIGGSAGNWIFYTVPVLDQTNTTIASFIHGVRIDGLMCMITFDDGSEIAERIIRTTINGPISEHDDSPFAVLN